MTSGKGLIHGAIEASWMLLSHRYRDINDRTGDEEVEGKIVVVTGANAGIGRAVATQFAKRNAIVVMASRNLEKTEKVAEEIRKVHPNAQLFPVKLDLSNFESVRQCAGEITGKYPHINILINNAGYMNNAACIQRTPDNLEIHMATNHYGHFLFTLLLVPHLKKGAPSRVVSLGSTAWKLANLNMDDLNMEKDQKRGIGNFRAYGNSKLCNFLFARELSKKLKESGSGVNTYCLCPGFNNTELFTEWTGALGSFTRPVANLLAKSPDDGAETTMYCALASELKEKTGKPYHWRKFWEEMDQVLDNYEKNGVCSKIWEYSENIVGLKWSDIANQ